MNETNKSEAARLREQIELEYQATQRMFTDFTPTARHEFIIKRQENIAACFEELKKLIPPEETIVILVETLDPLQPSGSSSGSNRSSTLYLICKEKHACFAFQISTPSCTTSCAVP